MLKYLLEITNNTRKVGEYKMSLNNDCFYCVKDSRLTDIMLKVCDLEVSTLYLFKEQTYSGRCLVAYNGHVDEICDLSDEERDAFMKDVAVAAKAMHKAFKPVKVNYGAYGDTMHHLHYHLVPKYEGGPDFGGVFRMNPQAVYLTDEEYNALIAQVKENL